MSHNALPAEQAQATPPPAAAASEDSEGPVFSWLRELDLVRDRGWIGGVCAAIAGRIGVDPVIVRGILIVVSVLGFPALWLYAIAWALLPDGQGRIPLQMRAGSAAALVGVAATSVTALLTLWAGNSLFEVLAIATYPGRWLWSIAEAALWVAGLGVIATLVILVLGRRSARNMLPLTGADGAVSGTAAVSGGVASGATPPPSLPEPQEPLASELATEADLATWRQQHAAWREQHEQWRLQQAGGPQAAEAEERARRAAERAAFRAEAARVRAERRAAKPRTSVAFVTITAGAALVAATAVWIGFQPNAAERAWPAAVLAAAGVTGLAMIVAGILRRRSGFLAAVSAILLTFAGSGLAAHAIDDLIGPDRYVPMAGGEQEVAQPFGTLTLGVGGEFDDPGITRIQKGSGEMMIFVTPGVDVEFETTSGIGEVHVQRFDDEWQDLGAEFLEPHDGRFTWSFDDENTSRTRTIVLDQPEVDVFIEVQGVER